MILSVEQKLILLFVSGLIVVLASGYLGWFGFENLVAATIVQYRRLNEKNGLLLFKKLPLPLDFKVYFFNVINPDAVLNGQLPLLQEVGPYVYEEYVTKDILNSTNPKLIRYNKNLFFKFSKEKSKGLKDSDVVTVINLPLLVIALFLERTMPLGLDLFDSTIPYLFKGNNKLFLTETVGDILFNGVTIRCSEESLVFCNALKHKPQQSIKYDETSGHLSFAFFRKRNGSTGPYEADKGTEDISKVGQIYSYKDQLELNTWVPNSTCNLLRGTDATMFSPFLEKDRPLYIFEPDICFSGLAEYAGETEYLGIPASKYVGSRNNFAEINSTCRCPREDYNDEDSSPLCLKQGLIDLTPCQGGPVIASQPHFYQGDIALRFSSVLRAETEKHQTYSIIDRLSGYPLAGKKRFQLNVQLKPIEDVSLLDNVSEIVFPVLWVEEGIELQLNDLVDLNRVYKMLLFNRVARWVLMGLGLLLILLGLLYYAYRKNNKKIDEIDKQPPQTVLFSQVRRNGDINSYENSNAAPQQLCASTLQQLSGESLVSREDVKNNVNRDNNEYGMTLSTTLYPDKFSSQYVNA